jgi:hypothetical protein
MRIHAISALLPVKGHPLQSCSRYWVGVTRSGGTGRSWERRRLGSVVRCGAKPDAQVKDAEYAIVALHDIERAARKCTPLLVTPLGFPA